MKQADQKPFAEILKMERKLRGWSQAYVAEKLGTDFRVVSRWERGLHLPTTAYHPALCDLFALSAEELGLAPHIANSYKQGELSRRWRVPYRRNPCFTGREELLSRLHDRLRAEKAADWHHVVAISGLGGIGKTQVAIEYSYRHRQDYETVFWLNARDGEEFQIELVELARFLKLVEEDEQNQRKAVEAIIQWFHMHSGWLLIVDDVDEITPISQVIPTEMGSVLLTTQTQMTGVYAQSIILDTMTLDESALFLLRRAKLIAPDTLLDDATDADWEGARAVAQLLGGLPLALDQAGAYLEEAACSFSDYLNHYRQWRASLLNRRGHLASEHPSSVSATFEQAFERVKQENPLAGELLRLCTLLDADAIPEELLTEVALEMGQSLAAVGSDALLLDEALIVLRKYSLLYRNPQSRTLFMHQLVQAVIQDTMNQDEQQRWIERIMGAINRLSSAASPKASGKTEADGIFC
ncbi:MAG TPA: NB-ARC domain-containing protein [Ktedonobacteraceae bacterium]|nr:NB-ARC domain-containing protein [Ktedonobacteraceae bacterium]